MKKIIVPILMLTLLMAACGNNDNNHTLDNIGNNDNDVNMNNDVENDNSNSKETNANPANEDPTSDQDYFKEKMETLNFFDFQLEVEYADGKEYEAEVDQNSDGTYDVKIEDELNGVRVQGREAFDDIFPRLEQLDLTSQSTNDEVIAQILKAFELSDDYVKFDVEIEFDDGVELEFSKH